MTETPASESGGSPAEIRALAGASDPLAAARACVERFCNPPSYVGGPPDVRAAKELMPRLLAAVEATIGFHVEAVIEDTPEPFRYCKTCSGHPKWPCPEVAAITRELRGGSGA